MERAQEDMEMGLGRVQKKKIQLWGPYLRSDTVSLRDYIACLLPMTGQHGYEQKKSAQKTGWACLPTIEATSHTHTHT